MSATAGSSTVETLVALVVFSLGALGALGTLGAAIRGAAAGHQSAAAARLGTSAFGRVAAGAHRGQTPCDDLPTPSLSGTDGLQATALLAPGGPGREVRVVLRYPGLMARTPDTVWSFVRCR